MTTKAMKQLIRLYESHFGCSPQSVTPLTGSASNRRYYRLISPQGSCIAVQGDDVKENRAFVRISDDFRRKGINVPEVYAVSEDEMCYIQEDLGDKCLSDAVSASGMQDESSVRLLCEVAAMLAEMQMKGADGFDFGICHPQPAFDRQMVMFDLNYFKYCFLKPSGLEFDEFRLQKDLESLADALVSCMDGGAGKGMSGFMHRDFQARNVMVRDGKPYFIDFQGGRRGPLHYDVASFIWHARSGYPDQLKEKMLDSYMDALSGYIRFDREQFRKELGLFVLLRTLQVLGAYGFRGIIEQKARFVTNIPAALESLGKQLTPEIAASFPYLHGVLAGLCGCRKYDVCKLGDGRLTVEICSFSYKKGIPCDYSGNGGGYVFDCRSIHNPGRYAQYRDLTGRDEAVIRFLEEDGEILRFLEHVCAVVDPHVGTYMRRGFTRLMVSFGCTGGQHRSVYCAEHLAHHLAERYPHVRVRLIHREQAIDECFNS